MEKGIVSPIIAALTGKIRLDCSLARMCRYLNLVKVSTRGLRLLLWTVTFLALAVSSKDSSAGSWRILIPASDLPQSSFDPQHEEILSSGECTISFSGQIMPGDLTSALDSGLLNSHIRLCLNSEGGSIGEVYQFITQLQERGGSIPTRVQAGDRCWSACAVLFVNGRSLISERYAVYQQDSILDTGASLGFHTPFIPEEVEAGVARESAFLGGIQMANLLFQATYNEPQHSEGASYPLILPPELVSIMFSTPPNEMYIIDSVGIAKLIGLNFSSPGGGDYASPGGGNLLIRNDQDTLGAAMLNICVSSRAMHERRRISTRGFQFQEIVDYINQELDYIRLERDDRVARRVLDRPVSSVRISAVTPGSSLGRGFDGQHHYLGVVSSDTFSTIFGNASRYYCRVEIFAEPVGNFLRVYGHRVGIANYQFIEQEGLEPSDEIMWLEPFGIVPITTGIARNYTVNSSNFNFIPVVDVVPLTSLGRDVVLSSCWLTTPTARITNVNEYVNLRRQPDFSAPVVRQVPLGERVRAQRADNITVIGQERDRQSCINACRAFGANREDRSARDRAQQCIQDNMIWYEVTDARNNRGWVSRRYLEETQ